MPTSSIGPIVIIGGDAAGMSAASEARRKVADAKIIVLEATQDVSYGACGLPYKLLPGTNVQDLSMIPVEKFRTERKLDVRLGHVVQHVDTKRKVVRGVHGGEPFELSYDKLLIATGAKAVRPPISGLDELWGSGVYTLKTLQDGRDLTAALAHDPVSVVVIGGGYIGLETTETLRRRGINVTVIETLPHLAMFLPESMRMRLHEQADKHGVSLVLGTAVQKVLRVDEKTIQVVTSRGEVLTELVVCATGVSPNVGFLRDSGISFGASGAIAVDAMLRTSAEDVYAAGDCADATHLVTGQSVWIPLALRANRAGKLAGRNMTGSVYKAPPVLGTAAFKFFDLEVARTGLSFEQAKQAGFRAVRAEITSGTRAHYYPGGGKLSVELVGDRDTGKLLGGCMVGPESAAHRIDTVATALHAGMTAAAFRDMDLAYAPPFGPAWSALLVAASKLTQAMGEPL